METIMSTKTTKTTKSAKATSSGAQSILTKAKARGSNAETVKGAIAYLLSHLPLPIPGLAYLSDPVGRRPSVATTRRSAWDRAVSGTHDERADKRAVEIAERILKKRPARPFSKVRSVCRRLTADIAERVTKRLQLRLASPLAQALANNWPYRRSTSGWAGGHHFVEVRIGQIPNAVGGSDRVWSKNGKWSGTNSSASLSITPRCYETFGSNLVIGGLITLDCEPVGVREYRAIWAAQSKGFELKVAEGWLIRGYHVEGGTLEAARRKEEKARRERLATLQVAKLGMAGIDLSQVWVTRADSVRAGNCSAGTDSFINSHADVLDGRTSIRADELLRLVDDSYTRAAVLRAIARTLAEGRLQGVTLAEEGAGGANPVADTGVEEAMRLAA
jgi:hypothetical protein